MESASEDTHVPESQKFKKNKCNRSGVDYEVTLTMVFLKRAEENHFKFELATELSQCEKFDNLYFKDYTSEKKVYFLHVNHKDNLSKRISFDDLKSQSDNDFSLLKYFNSYRKIKEKQEFQNDFNNMNFILCTTIHFDNDGRYLNNTKSVKVMKVTGNDGIFNADGYEIGERYKLKIKLPEEREEIFRNFYSSLKTMASKLVECALEEKYIDIAQIPSIRRYQVPLAEYVIDAPNQNFRLEFLNNVEGLSENVKNFRQIFYTCVREYLSEKKKLCATSHAKERKKIKRILEEFQEILAGSENDTHENILSEILQRKKLKLVGNFGNLHIKKLPEFIRDLCAVLKDPQGKILEVTKATTFGRNITLLGGYVMILENGIIRFNEEFLISENLPVTFTEFRNSLDKQLFSDLKIHVSHLKTCELNFAFKTQDDSKSFRDQVHWDLDEDLTSYEVMNAEIDDFLEKLTFVVTPKSSKMRKLIEIEMRDEFGSRGENIFSLLNLKTLDWMNYRDDQERGYYLTHMSNIYAKSKKHCLGSKWFRVKNTVKLFTGRDVQLEMLRNSPCESIVVINGLSGVGKTELALKFVDENYVKGDNVIWIDAETHASATESFRTLCKELCFKINDEHEEQKSIKIISEGLYNYFVDVKTLFVFDNAESLAAIEEFLPQNSSVYAKTLRILITSPNNFEWKSSRHHIALFHLDDFTNLEATSFVERALVGVDNNPESIIKLTKKLYNFPLALDQAVTYIRDENEDGDERKFSISDYLKKYEETPKFFLNVNLPPDAHVEGTFKTLNIIFKKIRNNEEWGHKAIRMLNIMAYLSQSNIPEKTFLDELIENDYGKLTRIIRLLRKYSTVGLEKGMLNIHGLVQKVKMLELEGEPGKEILQTALELLKKYLAARDSVECYVSHIISLWKYASKYDQLIDDFIVKDIKKNIALPKNKKTQMDSVKERSRREDSFSSSTACVTSTKVPRTTSYLHVLAGGSSYEVFHLILDKIKESLGGPKMVHKFINVRSEDKKTLLHYAAQGGDVRIVDLLLENKANTETRDRIDSRPLHVAARHGHLPIVKALIDEKADVNAKTSPEFVYTPLHFAAQNGHLKIVEVLLSRNAEVNSKTKRGFTPLHLASLKGYLDVVEILLINNADVSMETNNKYTALHFAVKNDHLNIVKVLLERGANINAVDNKNFTPLHWAALNGFENIVNYFLMNPLDLTVESTEGKTALHLADEKGHVKVIAALTAAKLNNKQESTAL